MDYANFIPIVLASAVFLFLGISTFFKIESLSDFLPISRIGRAKITSSSDFSASTVATTVSLATLIAAYFNLANFFGLWLLWTALTAAIGMYVVYLFSDRISAKLEQYDFVPSIHEFLAAEYSSGTLRVVAASFTVVGLLLLLATELLVGSRFLGAVIPQIPGWVLTISLSLVAMLYVIMGGFSTVIRTDRLQMRLIWVMIPALLISVIFVNSGGGESLSAKLQKTTLLRPIDSGVIWFLVGLFLMNVPTHLSSITVWQRASACANKDVLKKGLFRSALGVFVSWSLLVLVAWIASACVGGNSGQSVFCNLISSLNQSAVGRVLGFTVLLGAYSALLSTASTFLIAIGHTFTTDIFARVESGTQQVAAKSATFSRVTILLGTVISCGAVAVLEYVGFKIEDLIFSIYGGALSLFPPIVLALMKPRERLVGFGTGAIYSIGVGFISGWGVALYGKLSNIQNMVFMSPAVGMLVSAVSLLCFVGIRSICRGNSDALSIDSETTKEK